MYFAIVPAAGSSQRFGGSIAKPYLEIAGKTVLEHSIQALIDSKLFQAIVIPVHKNQIQAAQFIVDQVKSEAVQLIVVVGGETRTDSVKAALQELRTRFIKEPSDLSSYICIHDAARCLVQPELIERCMQAASQYQAVCAGLPVIETIKQANQDQLVEKTLDRSKLWTIQTPQVFKLELLLKAFEQAGSGSYTDEAQLVEMIHPVKLIRGETSNFKITLPFDLEVAEYLLKLPG